MTDNQRKGRVALVTGAGYGLCQVYGNEPWHFGYLPDAVTYGCPAMHPDPTWDPRMKLS